MQPSERRLKSSKPYTSANGMAFRLRMTIQDFHHAGWTSEKEITAKTHHLGTEPTCRVCGSLNVHIQWRRLLRPSLLRVGNNPPAGVRLSLTPSLLITHFLVLTVIQRTGRRILRSALSPVSLLGLSPSNRTPSIQTNSIPIDPLNWLPKGSPISYLHCRTTTLINPRPTPPCLILSLIPLKLSRPQQRMYLAMSEDLDLFVGESAFHPVWVVAQVIFGLIVRVVFGGGCWRREWVVWSREVCCLEGLEVFL